MPIDLRSDTVTRPTPEMRAVMARADVGDDVYGEDPSVRLLEERVAELLGKERALFVPSGTMSNQIALLCHTSRSDEVYVGEGSHCAYYESGAGAAWAGVQFAEVGKGGTFTAAELEAAIRPLAYYMPTPRLVVVENTHNRGGGKIFEVGEVEAIAAVARAKSLGLHLDGARLWNAAAKTGLSERALAAPFDTVSVCFSKGLGAPVGSALAGSSHLIGKAHRFRKMLGGGMRQAGILASAALHALENHRSRLGEDHDNAARFAEIVSAATGSGLSPHPAITNIVLVETSAPAEQLAKAAAEVGVLVSVFGAHRLRIVTHMDVSRADVERAAADLVAASRALGRGKA
ncbi:MAG: GntG family PLP-dependent aldolase [Polyangiaceae bacterium]